MRFIILILTLTGSLFICDDGRSQEVYKGKPFNNTIQVIPGKLQCEFYDTGGEGIAYHDLDSVNGGSGRLNPANGNMNYDFLELKLGKK